MQNFELVVFYSNLSVVGGIPVITLSISVDIVLIPLESCSKNVLWIEVSFSLFCFVSLPHPPYSIPIIFQLSCCTNFSACYYCSPPTIFL